MSHSRKTSTGAREPRILWAGDSYGACKFDDMTAELVASGKKNASEGGEGTEARCGFPPAAAAVVSCRRHRPRHHPVHSSHSHSHSLRLQSTRARSRWLSLKKIMHRFGDLLIVSVWLLSTVRVPTAMSAPLGSADASRFNSKPKWINPCGGEANAELFTSDLPDSRSTDGKAFQSILLAARLAKDTAQQFRDRYVQKTFNVGFNTWHDEWKTKHYEWLPSTQQVPKSLGEPVPLDHLKKLKLDSFLKDIYQYLQMYAVGLEQVTWDQEDSKGEFASNFKDAEHALKATLCEVQALMVERSVSPYPDVQRSLMDSSVRENSNMSHRNLRDWLIYRDYMNGLEYVIQVLEYFEKNSS